jgi:hypothetical protein
MRFDRSAFYLNWPSGELATRNGNFVREIHLILFGFEFRWVGIDNVKLPPAIDPPVRLSYARWV